MRMRDLSSPAIFWAQAVIIREHHLHRQDMTIHSDNITPLPPMTEAVARLPHHMAVILCQLALLGELIKNGPAG